MDFALKLMDFVRFTSMRQLHQYCGDAIPNLEGCVRCDTMLDESTPLFKAARKLVVKVAMCIQIDELCIQNDGFCIQNDEFLWS